MTDEPSPAGRSLRDRVVRGVAGQGFGLVSRVVVQLGMAGVMLPAWGAQLYGEWLTIVGIALLLGASDLGFLQAAASDMAFSVARGDRDHARDVFRTVGCGLGVTFAVATTLVALLGWWAPLGRWLGLRELDETSATAILVMIALQAMCLMTCMLFFCGLACVGEYGSAFAFLSVIYLGEWVAAAVTALAGGGPLAATSALLAVRVVGMVAMYAYLRRIVPWLRLGRPLTNVQVRKRLLKPALAGAGLAWGTALNIQAMIVLVSTVAGAAAATTFATVRAVSRTVIQVSGSVGPAIGPEFARAYGEDDLARVRSLQRQVSQIGVWSALVMVLVLAFVGDRLIELVTRGTVSDAGPLLLVLLLGAVLEVAWYTAGANLYATNRHQRVGFIFTLATVAALVLAYPMVSAWGVEGAALAIVCLSVVMLAVMVRASLRGTGDSLKGWLHAVVDPRGLVRTMAAVRSRT